MGPFMVEIVFCPVTRRGRKKKKGMNKVRLFGAFGEKFKLTKYRLLRTKAGLANTRNDGPSFQFVPPEDTVKITMDLSDNGPVFSALDQMMLQGGGQSFPEFQEKSHCCPLIRFRGKPIIND